jgi:hypothetical protein
VDGIGIPVVEEKGREANFWYHLELSLVSAFDGGDWMQLPCPLCRVFFRW